MQPVCRWALLLLLFGLARMEAGESYGASRAPMSSLAQADEPSIAPAPPTEKQPPSPEQKRKTRSAAVLLSVLAGIALTGLLLLIISISARGLLRKLAGTTKLHQEPQDLLPDVAAEDDARIQTEPNDGAGAAADETQYT